MANFGERLATIVKDRGGVAAIAAQIDASEGALRKWMHGTSEPRLSDLLQLSEVLGVSIAWLTTGKGPQKVVAPGYNFPSTSEEAMTRLRETTQSLQRLAKEHGSVSTVWSTVIQELMLVYGLPEEGVERLFQTIKTEEGE